MRILLALLISVALSTTAHAEILEEHLKPTLKDGFDSTGLWIIAGGITATVLAQTQDYNHRSAWQNHQRMSESTADVGDVLGTGIPGAAIAITQLLVDHNNGIAHTEALIDTFVVTSVLKFTSQRSRPSSDNHHSMPSGHTSTAFASATSLTYSYGWKAAIPGYLAASFTAASRWADDAHWLSDTVAGAFVGFFWGRATALHHLSIAEGRILPLVDTKTAGLIWHWEF